MSTSEKNLIYEVLNEVSSRINPFAYYEGNDFNEILCDVQDYFLGKDDEN